MSTSPNGPRSQGVPDGSRPQGIAATITEVSERAAVLVREEIELAKAEIAEKTARLAKGAVVAVAAGIFLVTALIFILVGCAWLLYYELPIGNEFTYFWGFFAMAAILIVLGILAGALAARAVKTSAPPVPEQAIEQARKIRETVAAGSGAESGAAGSGSASSAGASESGTAGSSSEPRAAGSASEPDASTVEIPVQTTTSTGGSDGTTVGS